MVGKQNNRKYELSESVKWFWQTRLLQNKKQKSSGRSDQGTRSEVTGGAQMDGFCQLLTNLLLQTGIEKTAIFHKQSLELPGYFRPEKRWDILVIKDKQLLAAIEFYCTMHGIN